MEKTEQTVERASAFSRRRFLGYAGAFAGVGMITLQSCGKDDDNPVVTDDRVNLGSGDTGILNYAYALEQLEAAFYTKVLAENAGLFSTDEQTLLADIRDHEIAHREFFKAALGNNAIKGLTPNFAADIFSSRAKILETARTFEDLGVAAYNGAGKLISTAGAAYLVIAGQIVSVEARHAAYIRDLISNGSFADLSSLSALGSSNTNGLDGARTPAEVLALAQPFIQDKLNGDNLPK